MKTRVGLVIFTVIMASCMNHYCPTYDGAKGRSASMASNKKSKSGKIPTPYYKVTKQAEKD